MLEFHAVVFAGSVIGSGLLVWVLCKLAPALGLVDHPHGRKAHAGATPVIGGLAILLGAVLALLALLILGGRTDLLRYGGYHAWFAGGAFALLIMGILDDWRPIAARYKLLIQTMCCTAAVVGSGGVVGDIGLYVGPYVLSLGPLVIPFSILVMLTITNAINMIDGIDGLAGGISMIALSVTAKALVTADFQSAPFVVAMTGAVAGFLLFNFPLFPRQKAKAFLGDSGSLLLGYALAYMAIQYSAMPGRVFKPSTALWLFFIPVADTVWIYLRRVWIARAPYLPGRDHIHHILMEKMSARAVTWLLVGLSAALAGGAYLAERLGVNSNIVVGTWIGAFLLYGVLTHKAWRKAWDRSRAEETEAWNAEADVQKAAESTATPAPASSNRKKAPALPVSD